MSNDGAVVVGESSSGTTPLLVEAFYWTPAGGMRSLKNVLASQEVSLNGWSLISARAVTPDGTIIVGWGLNPQGNPEAWLAHIAGFGCYANCDQSTSPPILNVNDFICFLNRFNLGDPSANCDESPHLDINDFVCFMNRYGRGVHSGSRSFRAPPTLPPSIAFGAEPGRPAALSGGRGYAAPMATVFLNGKLSPRTRHGCRRSMPASSTASDSSRQCWGGSMPMAAARWRGSTTIWSG